MSKGGCALLAEHGDRAIPRGRAARVAGGLMVALLQRTGLLQIEVGVGHAGPAEPGGGRGDPVDVIGDDVVDDTARGGTDHKARVREVVEQQLILGMTDVQLHPYHIEIARVNRSIHGSTIG
jgi:hypothetical protein